MSIQQQQGDEERRRQEEQDAVNRYADAMSRRDRADPYRHRADHDLDVAGRPLAYAEGLYTAQRAEASNRGTTAEKNWKGD